MSRTGYMPRWVAANQPPDESDFAAVDQALQGRIPFEHLHPDDRRATVAALWRKGWSQVDSADFLGTDKTTIEADRTWLRNQARKRLRESARAAA